MVLARENLPRAMAQVRANKGAAGVDGRDIDQTARTLRTEWPAIRDLPCHRHRRGRAAAVLLPYGGAPTPTLHGRISTGAIPRLAIPPPGLRIDCPAATAKPRADAFSTIALPY